MRKRACLLLIMISSFTIPQEVFINEGEKETAVGNIYFTLYLSKERGWLLDRLEHRTAGVIMSDSHIYTDWGIYPRGYVGSKEEKEGKLRIEKEGENIVAVAEGILKREGRALEEPIRYIVRYKVGKERRIGIDIELEFEGEPRDVSAFLAQILVIPLVKQWFVNSVDGLISEDMGNVLGRCWESRDEPLCYEKPFIFVLTEWGSLRIEGIRSKPQAQNLFLYDGGNSNLVFFFAFLDGYHQELKSFKASFVVEIQSK